MNTAMQPTEYIAADNGDIFAARMNHIDKTLLSCTS